MSYFNKLLFKLTKELFFYFLASVIKAATEGWYLVFLQADPIVHLYYCISSELMNY